MVLYVACGHDAIKAIHVVCVCVCAGWSWFSSKTGRRRCVGGAGGGILESVHVQTLALQITRSIFVSTERKRGFEPL